MSPRLSLWKNEKIGKDAIWFDKHILAQFQIGGVDSYVHLYLGAENPNVTNDATQPNYPNLSSKNIQDLLFLENRDRKYAQDIYRIRCHYSVQDLDLDLSQFGLMIASGTLYITFHTKNMVDTIGRKLMSGDILELPNLKEFYSLDETIPVALKRFYVVQEGTRPAAGFSSSWWSHLWRCKCTPLVDSQEFSQILNQPVIGVNGLPIMINGNPTSYGNINSSIIDYNTMNEAIVVQAENEVPLSGYNTDALWAPLFVNGDPKQGTLSANASPQQKFTGYLVGNGEAVDGYPVTPSTEFPHNPPKGQYVLRQDYFPARLYRWNGCSWQYVDSQVRTPLTPGKGHTQRDTFVNNSNVFINSEGNAEPIIQTLSTLLYPGNGISMEMPNEFVVQYSPDPVFDLSRGTTFIITLYGDATPTFINPQLTQYTFIIIQDSIGGHTFNWSSLFRGAGIISASEGTANANTIATQTFTFVSGIYEMVADGPMSYGI